VVLAAGVEAFRPKIVVESPIGNERLFDFQRCGVRAAILLPFSGECGKRHAEDDDREETA
jgi:hypothetical protein